MTIELIDRVDALLKGCDGITKGGWDVETFEGRCAVDTLYVHYDNHILASEDDRFAINKLPDLIQALKEAVVAVVALQDRVDDYEARLKTLEEETQENFAQR